MALDPVTGLEIDENQKADEPNNMVQVDANEWNMLKAKMDLFEQGFNQAPAQNVPSGPSWQDQLSTFDNQLNDIDAKIDAAQEEGKPITKYLRMRDQVNQDKMRAQIRHEDIDPIRNQGLGSINELADEVFKGRMPHLNIVKKDYDAALSRMPSDSRGSLEARQIAYNLAVGQNHDKILQVEREKMMREAADQNLSGGTGSRGGITIDPSVPRFEDVVSPATVRGLRSQGITPDEFYQKRGYKDGWQGFYKKHKERYYDKKGY